MTHRIFVTRGRPRMPARRNTDRPVCLPVTSGEVPAPPSPEENAEDDE